jgi:carboxymethylenebutenolidase
MSSTVQIATPDGGQMDAYLALPESGSGPGMVVLMEIFGVTGYIREAADRLAAAGYVALAPDLYRRIRPGTQFPHDEENLPKALAAGQELEFAGAEEDAIAALEHLKQLPQTEGQPSGVLGFCLGGLLSYNVAIGADPATAVSYYGSGVADMLGDAGQITCPVLFHFGGEDPYIPREHAERVSAAAKQRPGWQAYVHPDAGHAFDNWDAPMFSRPQAARRAWGQTAAFLQATLPAQ